MKIMFILLVLCVECIIAMCTYEARRTPGRMAGVVFWYELISFICGIAFILYVFVPGITITTAGKAITLVSFDWILVILLYYTWLYTGAFKGILWTELFLIVYSVFDTVVLIRNIWTHDIFEVLSIGESEIICRFVRDSWLYKGHFMFVYAGMIFILGIYLVSMIRTSRFYRFSYGVIFFTFLLAFILDLLTIDSDSVYDLSMVVFGVMAVFIYYFTMRYVPNELIENTLSLVMKDVNYGIICFDYNGRCIYHNEIIEKIYGMSEGIEEYFEEEYARWIKRMGPKRSDSMRFDRGAGTGDDRRDFEIIYKRAYDDKDSFVCDYYMVIDRTAERKLLEAETYKATHDQLTGLLNRQAFYDEAKALIKRNSDRKYCIICTNVKDFKFVNELFGTDKGDEILRKQASLMNQYLDEDCCIARVHGDRFAVCMPYDVFAESYWEDITAKIREEFDDRSFSLHIIAGVYMVDDLDEPVSIMCDKANIASDTIKEEYQFRMAYYNKKLLEKSTEERRVIGELDRALANEEFVMFLQPQVDSEGTMCGAEGLVRWQHPQRGLLSPYFFIDVLEKAGLIYKLDRYIWEMAAKTLSEWKAKDGGAHHISVNISTKDFYLLDVYETFVGIVEKYDIDPASLKLEITETALMLDFEKNTEVITKLRDYGFKIEIDDFGSGYSSLNMLKDISADVLKIDMGFLRATENEVKGRDILESIISLASKLGMEVITEGVETKSQLDMLNAMGCRLYQGYYFSKPIPVDEFVQKYMS